MEALYCRRSGLGRADHKHGAAGAVVSGPCLFDIGQRTGLVAILKLAGTVARKSPSMARTRRSKGMLPMPLPMSTIADDLSAALGSVMSEPLTAPIWTNRIGTASAPLWRRR